MEKKLRSQLKVQEIFGNRPGNSKFNINSPQREIKLVTS